MQTTYTKDWKTFDSDVNVVGVTREDREANFLIMGDQPDFKIFLKKEPNNPVDPNAVKVMGSATVDGEKMVAQLGYIPKEIAQELSNEKEIDARPQTVWLPYEDRQYGLRIKILVRSAIYKKNKKKT